MSALSFWYSNIAPATRCLISLCNVETSQVFLLSCTCICILAWTLYSAQQGHLVSTIGWSNTVDSQVSCAFLSSQAMHLVSSMNIVHRDIKESGLKALYILLQIIKMENCLLCEYGNVKLADFGFARHMQSRLERSTSFCGTKYVTFRSELVVVRCIQTLFIARSCSSATLRLL